MGCVFPARAEKRPHPLLSALLVPVDALIEQPSDRKTPAVSHVQTAGGVSCRGGPVVSLAGAPMRLSSTRARRGIRTLNARPRPTPMSDEGAVPPQRHRPLVGSESGVGDQYQLWVCQTAHAWHGVP